MTRVALGFCSRTGSAVAVAVCGSAAAPEFAGRWDLDLTDGKVPEQMFHAAVGLPPAQAHRFIARTTRHVAGVTATRVRELVGRSGATCAGVVVGDHPVPAALERVLASHALTHAAEGKLYRDVLAEAAEDHGLTVTCLPRGEATAWLACGPYDLAVGALGSAAGRPWRKEHKLAAIAALAALEGPR